MLISQFFLVQFTNLKIISYSFIYLNNKNQISAYAAVGHEVAVLVPATLQDFAISSTTKLYGAAMASHCQRC